MLFRNDKDKKDDKEQSGGPARVPLLPLRDIIVFPHMVVPLFVGRQRSIKALEEATQKQGLIFFLRRRMPRPTIRPKRISIKSARWALSCRC